MTKHIRRGWPVRELKTDHVNALPSIKFVFTKEACVFIYRFVYLSKHSSMTRDDETTGKKSAAAELGGCRVGKNKKVEEMRQQNGRERQRWQRRRGRQTSGEKQPT